MTVRERARSLALVASSLAVLAAAVGFDVLADERPTHTLTVALAAGIVGVLRYWVQGRMRGVFVAVNLAVIGQPAAHALSKLTHSVDVLPHTHGWPQELSGLALHVAVALLVTTVAASEPVCTFVAARIVRTLVLLTDTPPAVGPPPSCRARRRRPTRAHRQQLLSARHARRRGPPAALAFAA